MMKQLLAKNKIVQRVKAVKDLFLEKLDSLSHVQFDQLQKLEKLDKLNQLDPLDFKIEQLNNSTEQIRQENTEKYSIIDGKTPDKSQPISKTAQFNSRNFPKNSQRCATRLPKT